MESNLTLVESNPSQKLSCLIVNKNNAVMAQSNILFFKTKRNLKPANRIQVDGKRQSKKAKNRQIHVQSETESFHCQGKCKI